MNTPVNLLWTGGWDSTFRLLSLVLDEGRVVQPHYIIDVERPSTRLELATMGRIKERVVAEAAGYILPMRVTPIYDIAPDEEITEAFHRLAQRYRLGSQYDWLARYGRQNQIDGLELSVHVDDRAEVFLRGRVADGTGVWRVANSADEDLAAVFGPFAFPLLTLSKVQMRELARQQGYLGILEMSWFCHAPVREQPCGRCDPCRFSIKEGMAYRLTRGGIIRNRLPSHVWGVLRRTLYR